MDPHKVMYYVSAVFGAIGILIAAFLHGPVAVSGCHQDGSRRGGHVPDGPIARCPFGPDPEAGRRTSGTSMSSTTRSIVVKPLGSCISHIFH